MKSKIGMGFLILLASLIPVSVCWALSGEDAKLEGIVRAFDENEVQLFSEGKIYFVPRKTILLSDLKSGQNIIVKFRLSELDALKSVPADKK